MIKKIFVLTRKLDGDASSPEWTEHLKGIDVLVKKYIKSHRSLKFNDFKVNDINTPKNIVILACKMSGVKSKKVINRYINKYRNDISKILKISEVGQPSSEDLFYVIPFIVALVVVYTAAVDEKAIEADENYPRIMLMKMYMNFGWIQFNERVKIYKEGIKINKD